VVGLSGAPHAALRAFRDAANIPMPLLSDVDGSAMRRLGVYHKRRADRGELARPSSLVFGPDGRLFRRRIVVYFRPSVDALLADVDAARGASRQR
jgi:peroxiredoxin